MGSSDEQGATKGTGPGDWLVNIADDVVVPMTTLEVIDALRKSRLSDQSLVWRSGMREWARLADVPQLRLAASSRPPAPAAPAAQLPFPQTAGQRRPGTLPLAFPGSKDRVNAAPRVASSPLPLRSPYPSASLAGRDQPLAIYDRPGASLTFSPSSRAEWQGGVDSRRLTPAPPVATPLNEQPTRAQPNSLAPTTAEADTSERVRAPGAWGDLDELLSNERRADQRNSRRVVIGASLGSATLVAVFALFVVRSPAPPAAERPVPAAQPNPAVQASPAAPPSPTLEASAAPSASVVQPAPATRPVSPKSAVPRLAKRPKPASVAEHAEEHAVDPPPAAPPPDTTSPSSATPVAPVEPTPTASATPEAAPAKVAPVVPITPDSP